MTMSGWTTHMEDYGKVLSFLKKVAEDNGFALNTDEARVDKVVGLMTENVVNEGARYCPCKQSEPLDKKADKVCPCPEWKEEITRDGHCFCRLFYCKDGV